MKDMYKLLHEACCAACAQGKTCGSDVEEADDEPSQTPASVKHCVAAVAKEKTGGDVDRAFAICVAAGQKSGTLKKGTMTPTAKGKKTDIAKTKDPEHGAKVGDYEKLLAKARKEGSEMSVRSEMMRLLGETEAGNWETHRDQGATSTGATNKPAKKTPKDSVKPGVATSGADDEADGVDQPFRNKPLSKEPRKSNATPPNVQTSSVDDFKRTARIYAGIDSKYELGDTMKPVEQDDTIVSESAQSDDPILKFAIEGMRSGVRRHPFE